MKMMLKRVGLHPDACPGPPGALSQSVSQGLAQMAPHFLSVHTRLAACGTVVTRTSGLSQMVHAPSPDLQLGPQPQREVKRLLGPARTRGLTVVAMQTDLGHLDPQEPPAPGLGDEGRQERVSNGFELPPALVDGGESGRCGGGRQGKMTG